MDVNPTVETNPDTPGKLKSKKRKLDASVVKPDLNNIFNVKDYTVPYPNECDLVVYMKRNGSGVGLAEVKKVQHKKTNPLYEHLCGSKASISTIPSGTKLNRCFEELHLVDRSFCVGHTVARFENAHPGGEKEKERWCKEDSQIGQVIAVKKFADVLVLPSKDMVVQNVPLDGSQLVDVLSTRPKHKYIMYEKWIGDVRASLADITLRYDDSHTAKVMGAGNGPQILRLIREDETDHGKPIVKGEVVSMSVQDALGYHCSWNGGKKPQTLLQKESDHLEKFTVEKVETHTLLVKWISSPGATEYHDPPDFTIDEDELSKVMWVTTAANPDFYLLERRIMKTPNGAEAISKNAYFKNLSQMYGSKFEKMGDTDRVARMGKLTATTSDGVVAKIQKLEVDHESNSEVLVVTDIPEENHIEAENEESGDEMAVMNVESDEGSSDATTNRRSRSGNSLAVANNSTESSMGEEFVGEVLRTCTVVDVEWLDGTVSRDVPGYSLAYREVDLDQEHHLPGTIVMLKNMPAEQAVNRFGLILSTNAADCCCNVRWFDRAQENPGEANFVQREDEVMSLFEITPHWMNGRLPLGRYYVQDPEQLGKVDLRDIVLQAVENLKNGKQKFRRGDGTFVEMWSMNVVPLHDFLDHLIMQHEEDHAVEPASDDSLPDFLDLLMPVDNHVPSERDYHDRSRDGLQGEKAELLIRLMTAPMPDDLVVSRVRWFEAAIMLVRSHRTPRRSLFRKPNWESGLLRDALDMAGFLNDYRYEARRGDSISDWIGRKLNKAGDEEKRTVLDYCYKLHVLTRKYPTWFDDMKDDMWKKYYFAMWQYLSFRVASLLGSDLFPRRMNVTMNKVEITLGESISEFYSEEAWKKMTVEYVLVMCDWAVHIGQPRIGVDIGRDKSLLIGHCHTTHLCANRLFRPFVDDLLEKGLLNRSYSDMLVPKSMNSWEDVYSDETKHRLDECLGDVPHTLRLKICGDSAVTMSDSFIWYHVMEQVVKPTDGALPTTIYIDPSISLASFEDGINRWSIMRWIVLMQCGVLSAPFYQVYPKNQEEDNYDVIEEAISANPQLADYRLQLAAVYDYARSVDLTPVCDRLNVFERLFPFKDILSTIRSTLSGTSVELPAVIVQLDTLKEFTSGKRAATVQQMRELKMWAGEKPTIPEKEPVVEEESDQDEKRFKMCAECPLSHKFVNSVMRETGLGRSFYTAVRNEHRLLMKHTPEGIHVRAFENRSDLLSFLIIGPNGTPFEGVPFYFDVRLSDSYPERPPEVHYVAFSAEQLNPNLYQSGKVCTSLLGTWQGEGVETWDSKKSNLLQVILSIQALILGREPYFNEAGYESRRELPDAVSKSKRYNELAAINALEYMWKVIQHPPAPFEKTIQHHVVASWPSLREKLLLWSKEETSLPDYPVLGSKGFRLALQKAVSRIDDSVKDKYDERDVADSTEAAVVAPTQLPDVGVVGTTEIEEEAWPPVQASGGERVSGVLDLLTDDNEVPYRRCFAFTEPVTCFMLRRE